MKKITFFVVLAALILASTPSVEAKSSSVWDLSSNCLVAKKGSDNGACESIGSAKLYGAAKESNGVYSLASTSKKKDYVFKDVNLHLKDSGYIVVAAHAKGDFEANDFTGRPYLYGYLMDEKKIRSYMQTDTMRYDRTDNGWGTVYGIFSVKSSDDAVRLFLKQANQKGEKFDGTSASFEHVGVYFVKTKQEAEEIVGKYKGWK